MSTYADAIRRQAEDAPRAALPAVSKAMWSAFAAGQITEAEAEALSALIEGRGSLRAARANLGATQVLCSPDPGGSDPAENHTDPHTPQDCQRSPRTGAGSRPRSDNSLERRRRWAASGRLPPQLAARFTLAEQAALAVIAVETVKRSDCRLYHEQIAAMAGVSRATVRATLRRARDLGVITIEERRSSAWRNLSSIVRIVCRSWIGWNRLVRRPAGQGGAVISAAPTNTKVLNPGKTRAAEAARGRAADLKSPSRTARRIAGA